MLQAMACCFCRADELAASQQNPEKENQPGKRGSGGSFFKKKTARRAKSLGKDHWDDVIFGKILPSVHLCGFGKHILIKDSSAFWCYAEKSENTA